MEFLQRVSFKKLNVKNISNYTLAKLYTKYYDDDNFIVLAIRKANGIQVDQLLPDYEISDNIITFYHGKARVSIRFIKNNFEPLYNKKGEQMYEVKYWDYKEFKLINLHHILSISMSFLTIQKYMLYHVIKRATEYELLECFSKHPRLSNNNYSSLLWFKKLPNYMKPDMVFISTSGSKLKAHKFIMINHCKLLNTIINDTSGNEEILTIKLPFSSRIIRTFIISIYHQRLEKQCSWNYAISPQYIEELIHIFDYMMVIDKSTLIKKYLMMLI